LFDRLHDMDVAGTAAQVTRQAFMNLRLSRRGRVSQQTRRCHDHAGRAKAALQAVALGKGRLNRVQLRTFGQSFNRGDLSTVGLHCQHGARLDRVSVHEQSATAALAGVAADVGAGQFQRATQDVGEQGPVFDLHSVVVSVHIQGDGAHDAGLSGQLGQGLSVQMTD